MIDTAPEFRSPLALTDVRLEDYDAVYVPGGHGPMEDLAADADSGRILTRAVEGGLPVGVVCHGPAALLAAVKEDGTNAYAGYRITAFTNTEEQLAGHAGAHGSPASTFRPASVSRSCSSHCRPACRHRPEPGVLRTGRGGAAQEARLRRTYS